MVLTSYDSSGAAADVDGTNAPTAVVTDSAGVVVGGFTPARTGTGAYSLTLPNNLEVLDTYTVAWQWANGQSRSSQFELVGGFIFTVADLRAYYAPFANATNYPTATLKDVRDAVEDVFELDTVTKRAFRPRGVRLTVAGTGTTTLPVGVFDTYRVVSVVPSSGTAPAVALVRPTPSGSLELAAGWNAATYTVFLEFGFRQAPTKIKQEALKYAKALMLEGPLDEGRATAVFTDIGGYRLTIAGRDGPTGIPTVDAALAQYSRVGSPVG